MATKKIRRKKCRKGRQIPPKNYRTGNIYMHFSFYWGTVLTVTSRVNSRDARYCAAGNGVNVPLIVPPELRIFFGKKLAERT